MARQRNAKWLGWLNFLSIKNYLNGSIQSKSSKIGSNATLEEKCDSVNLTNYLKGVEVFLKEYTNEFNEPSEIIDHYKEIRDNDEALARFKQLVENYIVWLKETKGLSANTSQNYQAHLRGFLKWNNIIFKFRNYNETSERAKERRKLGIDFKALKEMSFKVIGYVNDFDLKLLLRWLQISGLGSREIFKQTFGDLRYKDLDQQFVRIDGDREKTGIDFTTFVYGYVKDDIQKHLKLNKDRADDEFIFGDPKSSYQNFQRRYKRAYKTMIDEEYPQFKESKPVFTMHGYRGIFETICRMLRVPKHIEEVFVAHLSDNITRAYVLESELLENFKLVQEELFGVRESDTREQIEREIIQNLTNALMDKGKRKTIFNKCKDATADEIEAISLEYKMNYLIESIIDEAKKEIIENPDKLIQNENFINALIQNDNFIENLAKKIGKINRII